MKNRNVNIITVALGMVSVLFIVLGATVSDFFMLSGVAFAAAHVSHYEYLNALKPEPKFGFVYRGTKVFFQQFVTLEKYKSYMKFSCIFWVVIGAIGLLSNLLLLVL